MAAGGPKMETDLLICFLVLQSTFCKWFFLKTKQFCYEKSWEWRNGEKNLIDNDIIVPNAKLPLMPESDLMQMYIQSLGVKKKNPTKK